ncbi:hypothetical protein LNTAR_23034 [Lentisphaera araneosa HTCC2155]|uniref:Uncharacterized protein n=1 Tax=Lentisphaera araneosa HTCC2155 TaxID=313628 RepID=A6DGJ8_9BACT|nr:hypothetical protein LNTAR_23034 [Lentisphaera araneosa HTCC2155]
MMNAKGASLGRWNTRLKLDAAGMAQKSPVNEHEALEVLRASLSFILSLSKKRRHRLWVQWEAQLASP